MYKVWEFKNLKICFLGRSDKCSQKKYTSVFAIVETFLSEIRFRELQYRYHQILLKDSSDKQTMSFATSSMLLNDLAVNFVLFSYSAKISDISNKKNLTNSIVSQ